MLTCPSCGAPAEPGHRHCGYCGAPVATVRCATCFVMNFPSSAHCTGCGRDLGLEPIPDASELACPDCTLPMSAFAAGPGRLYDCGRCGGQLVEHALLRDLLERREICGAQVPARKLAAPGDARKVRYVPCPVCRALMNRENFGGSSGVVIDLCSRHGVWFDAGELPRVLEFVESGGLARARQRRLEELSRSERELRARAVASLAEETVPDSLRVGAPGGLPLPDGAVLAHREPPAWKEGLWDDARSGLTDLLQQLGELVAKYR